MVNRHRLDKSPSHGNVIFWSERFFSLRVAILFLLFGQFLVGAGLPVTFNHISAKDGLSMNAVYEILEDSQGFMWFGTRFGLNRYDGREMKTFLFDPMDDKSIPGAHISAIIEDADSIMWIGTTSGGFSRYDRDSESFQNFHHDPEDHNSLVSNKVTCLFSDSRGALWIGTEEGLSRFDPSTGEFRSFHPDPENERSLAQDRILSIAETPGGKLWVGTENGAATYISLDDYRMFRKVHIRPSTSIGLSAMLADPIDSCLWIGRFGVGMHRWDYRDKFETINDRSIPLSPMDGINSISKDQDGSLWLGSADGMTNYNHKTGKFIHYYNDPDDPGSIGDDLIYTTYVDSKGILWVGTGSAGVSVYDPSLVRFQLVQSDPEGQEGILSNAVFSISQDQNGNLWFGTLGGGASVKDARTGAFTHYNSFETLGVSEWWSRDYIARIISDRDHKIWIGTFSCGLFTLDYPTQTLNHYRNRENVPTSLSDKTIRDMIETRDGEIWIGTETAGLERYNPETDDFTHFQHDPADPKSISSNTTYSMLEDRAGYIWVGTTDRGLNQFDRKTGEFKRYVMDPENENSLSSDCIPALYEDADQTLWIGTRSGGLCKLNRERTEFSILDLHWDPSDISISSILQDDKGFLWLSTNHGILKAHPDSGLVNQYSESDGVQEDFYFQSRLKADDGCMYFGGGAGYNVFHPDSIQNNEHVPPLVITGLSINYKPIQIGEEIEDRVILDRSITQSDELNLSYRDKVITLKFAALNYSASYKNHYAYMLEGYDENWIDADFTPVAQYMNLPAGDYLFKVRGSNNDGIWNMEGTSLRILISPPFWKTWWFKAMTLLVLLASMIGYIKLRTYRLIAQRDKLEALVRERTTQLKKETEERQKVELEKTELRMDHLKRELLTQSLHLNEKQQIMDNLQDELEQFSKLTWNDARPRISKLLRFLRDRSTVKQGWEEFEIWFTEIHTGFYSHLRNDHPQLSESELKVCALLRLNLISKDIAKVMNVQPSSIDIYRHRIRKKLELSSEDNLTTYLSRF